MKIEVGDVIFSLDKTLLVIHEPKSENPIIMIDLDNFKVDNAWPTLERITNSTKRSKTKRSKDRMAVMDYGAILKINGKLININQSLFMDMKETVGFTIDPIPYQHEYNGTVYSDVYVIDGNYFIYFGDENILFCVYKTLLRAVVNSNEVYDFYFDYNEKKVVKYFEINGSTIKIKKICDQYNKIHASVQYNGNRYEVIYGYGIDNNVKTFRDISRKKRYGYNTRITRYVDNFLQ